MRVVVFSSKTWFEKPINPQKIFCPKIECPARGYLSILPVCGEIPSAKDASG
jgi:hypothetical protein